MTGQIFKLLPLFKESRDNIFCLHLKWNFKSFASSRTAKEAAEPLVEGFHRDNEAKSIMKRTEKTGLYGFDVLKTAKGFRTFVREAIERYALLWTLQSSAETPTLKGSSWKRQMRLL